MPEAHHPPVPWTSATQRALSRIDVDPATARMYLLAEITRRVCHLFPNATDIYVDLADWDQRRRASICAVVHKLFHPHSTIWSATHDCHHREALTQPHAGRSAADRATDWADSRTIIDQALTQYVHHDHPHELWTVLNMPGRRIVECPLLGDEDTDRLLDAAHDHDLETASIDTDGEHDAIRFLPHRAQPCPRSI